MVMHESMTWAFIDTTKNSKVMKKLVHSLLHAVTAISKKTATIVLFLATFMDDAIVMEGNTEHTPADMSLLAVYLKKSLQMVYSSRLKEIILSLV